MKLTKLNKKAQESFSLLQTIPRIIFLIVVLFSIVYLIRTYVVTNLNVQETQSEVFMNRIIYSQNGISFSDELGVNPGIIDPAKITNANLDAMMDYDEETFIAGKVQLVDIDGKEVASGVYNEKTYNRWKPIASVGVSGAGGVSIFTKNMYVNYLVEGSLKPGFLKMEVLLPGK